jgi:hypothetical protein
VDEIELRDRARKLDVSGASTMRKEELTHAVAAASSAVTINVRRVGRLRRNALKASFVTPSALKASFVTPSVRKASFSA